MKKTRVVVTGIGMVTSIGIGKDAYWDNLLRGCSGISEVDAFDTSQHFNHYGGQVKKFRPQDFMHARTVKLVGRASQFAIASTRLALKDAGIAEAAVKHNPHIRVLIGTTSGEIQEMEAIDASWVAHGKESVDLWKILHYPVNNISSNVALEFKITGKNCMFTTACAAGNYAIGHGFDLLQEGKADTVIAGGTDSFSYLSFTGFGQVSAMAPRICQPFDKNRKGMLLGEGGGMLILETEKAALKRGAHIYAEIIGYGLSCDASHMTNPHPDGVTHCMQNALQTCGITADQVDYICAHGTGTRHNDKTECAAIKRIFGDRRVPVSSIKSMLGHTMGAASAIEAITCCLAAENDVLPPTTNFETPDPECDVDCVPNQARKLAAHVILNNGFAFGGNNSCLVIKKYTTQYKEAP